ncbi:MAG: tyrosine/phenylalanine carboxypeptidase domain-containing protein [Candidatus Dojkabacteria bacterium]|jgi:hypothetical protein
MSILKKRKNSMSLKDVTSLLNELRIPTALVFTPINLKSEKKKFFNSEKYNPLFQYRIVKNSNKKIFEKLSDIELISDVDPRISDFYIGLIEAKKEAAKMMNAVGNNEAVTEISVSRYGKPTPILFRNASKVLRGRMDSYDVLGPKTVKKLRGDYLGYDEIERIFSEVFKEFDLEDWAVDKSMNITKNGVKVGMKTKKVLVDPNIERSRFKLKKTLVHEVGTHVLRGVNGLESGFEVFSKPNYPSYLDVEEGLATWNEHDMGLLSEEWLRKKAALVYALYVGEEMSFRQLYNCVLGILPKYSAFNTVYRVKRGLGDTSFPGIYAKDITYFRGFRRVLNRLKKDSSLYELLYAGKIGFKETEWVREGLLPRPKRIPSKEKWEEVFRKVGL